MSEAKQKRKYVISDEGRAVKVANAAKARANKKAKAEEKKQAREMIKNMPQDSDSDSDEYDTDDEQTIEEKPEIIVKSKKSKPVDIPKPVEKKAVDKQAVLMYHKMRMKNDKKYKTWIGKYVSSANHFMSNKCFRKIDACHRYFQNLNLQKLKNGYWGCIEDNID